MPMKFGKAWANLRANKFQKKRIGFRSQETPKKRILGFERASFRIKEHNLATPVLPGRRSCR